MSNLDPSAPDLKEAGDLPNIDPSAPEEADVNDECEDIISTMDINSWHKEYDPPIPTEVLAMCMPNQRNICKVKLNSEIAKLHYQGKWHH